MSNYYSIRCPTCLATNSVVKNASVSKVITCNKCKRKFEFKDALPMKTENNIKPISSKALSEIRQLENLSISNWVISIIGIILIVIVVRLYDMDMLGSDFIVFYIFTFIITILVNTLCRWYWKDILSVSILGFVLFELIGVVRYIDALNNDMQNFSGLQATMFIGGVLFFVRTKHFNNTDNSSGDCSSCSGGSCGGGCGGCGG